MKYLPHQILKFLSDNYSDNTIELNEFLLDKLSIYKTDVFKANKLKTFLTELETKDYIIWEVKIREEPTGIFEPHESHKKNFGSKDRDGKEQSLLNNKVCAKLTTTGIDYVLSMDRLRQQHNIYKVATPLTAIFAFFALVVSITNCVNTCKVKPVTQQQQDLLTPRLPLQNNTLPETSHIKRLQIQKPSETNVSKFKDTPVIKLAETP